MLSLDACSHASTLVIDETEAEVVRQVFRWCLEGKTLRWITMELNTGTHSYASCPPVSDAEENGTLVLE